MGFRTIDQQPWTTLPGDPPERFPDLMDLRAADQIKIACGRGGFQHRETAIPPTSTHGRRLGKSG